MHEEPAGCGKQHRVDGEHQRRDPDEGAHQGAVCRGQPVESAVERAEAGVHRPHQQAFLGMPVVRLQQQRAQRRAQGQRVEGGDDGRGRDRHGELPIELPGDAAEEGGRNEHGGQHERDRDQRGADLVHGDARGLRRRQPLAQLALDVLDDDDCVVDDDADGEHEAEQRQHVDGEAEPLHHREGADERDGDGGERNDGRAPRLQEDDDDDDDERDRLEDRAVELGDRDLDELGRVIDDAVLEVLGEPLRQSLHRLLDRIRRRDRVRAGLLRDDQHGRRVVVLVAVGGVAQRAELDAADVLHAHDAAVLPRLQHDVLELARVEQAPLELQRQLEGAHVALRRLAERAAGDLDVLRAQRGEDLIRGHAAQCDALRVEPDAHRVFARPEHRDIADAGDAGKLVAHVEQRVVGAVDLIVGLLRRDEVHDEQEVGHPLVDDDAVATHLLGQARLGHRDAVLHQHLRLVDVGADLERDAERHGPVVGRLRVHVDHALDAVHLLLDDGGDGIGDGYRVGAWDRSRSPRSSAARSRGTARRAA